MRHIYTEYKLTLKTFLLFYIIVPLVFSQEIIEEDQQCRVRIVDCENKQVYPKTQLISGKKNKQIII